MLKRLFLLVLLSNILPFGKAWLGCYAQAPDPELEFVVELKVNLGQPYGVGETAHGNRFIIPITGGTFEGPNIKGEVLPKQAKPVNKYTLAVGTLNMKSKTLDLGTVKKGENKSGELEYANLGKDAHHVELATNGADAYLINQVTLADVKANETGKFVFAIDSKNPKLYGPQEAYAFVVIDGKKEIDETHKLTIKANIVEDFSGLSVEEKQQAPIIELPAEFNAGKVAAGKNLKFSLPIKNIGVNPLEIRRAYAADKAVNVKQPKAVKSGKKGSIAVEINTKGMNPGAYGREVVVITNDYMNPIKRVKVNFVVE